MPRTFYPCLLMPLDNANRRQLPEERLCADVVLRNLSEAELESINLHVKSWGRFGLSQLEADRGILEIRLDPLSESKTPEDLQAKLRDVAFPVARKALNLLRLADSAPIAVRFFAVPMADEERPAFSLVQTAYLPAVIPDGRHRPYPIHPDALPYLRWIFGTYWSRSLDKLAGVRWLEKTYGEIYWDDRLTQAVFGLEQILLRGEKERSYLTFKMALRGAWLLAPRREREVFFKRMQQAYKLRSDIAHGNVKAKMTEDEKSVTDFAVDTLRRLILLQLELPSSFDSSGLNRLTLGVEPSPADQRLSEAMREAEETSETEETR